MTYPEMLLDPRWQKKRLEIFERDKFSCVICKNSSETLHVHHHFYLANKKPWEYKLSQLSTLCKSCHDQATKETSRVKHLLTKIKPKSSQQVAAFLIYQILKDGGCMQDMEFAFMGSDEGMDIFFKLCQVEEENEREFFESILRIGFPISASGIILSGGKL